MAPPGSIIDCPGGGFCCDAGTVAGIEQKWYREQCGENISADEDAITHYLDGGWKLADPSEHFSNNDYLCANTDVRYAPLAPLEHYLLHGKKEERLLSVAPEAALRHIGRYHTHTLRRTLSQQWGRICCAKMIERNSKARILVCVQLFYPHSWGRLSSI